jgi:hypothetical protein
MLVPVAVAFTVGLVVAAASANLLAGVIVGVIWWATLDMLWPT